jgi:dihydroorotate dehydrogenase
MFRLPKDRALINRMGFNNEGCEAAARRLRKRKPGLIVGVNIGKTKKVPEEEAISDYVKGARRLAPLADYMVVNVSSPNTPGLRNLQAVDRLRPLLTAVREAMDDVCDRRVPLLVKISPDLADEDVDAVADLALELSLDGIIATNTTIARDGLRSADERVEAIGAGGLSGAPLKQRSLEVLKRLRARVGDSLVLISAGGIETAEDAQQRLEAGATLLQAYSAFVYGGPLWPSRLQRRLSRALRQSA